MIVVDHPYLAGVKCRDDGAVWIPAARGHAAHWTFGAARSDGYRSVAVARKYRAVHRLICEAFHGTCPEDKTVVDHIDRNPANNCPGNLRWATISENNRNTRAHEASVAMYGVAWAEDENAYRRARRVKKKAIGRQPRPSSI